MAGSHIAEFEMVHAKTAGQFLSSFFKHRNRLGIDSSYASINRERQGNQGVAKQPAFNLSQREDAPDATFVVLGKEKMGRMTEYVNDDPLPSGTMKKRRFAAMIDKHVPARSGGQVGQIEVLDCQHPDQISARKR